MQKDEPIRKSSMGIGQRVKKTQENRHGFQYVEDVPYDKPSILFFGGVGTDMDECANGYVSSVERVLKKHGINEGVGLYAILYDFGITKEDKASFCDFFARKKLFHDHFVPHGLSNGKIIKK